MQDDKIPKVFISYSWSSDALVLELANRLVSHGVDVVLDKWELKEGNDKYEFTEFLSAHFSDHPETVDQ